MVQKRPILTACCRCAILLGLLGAVRAAERPPTRRVALVIGNGAYRNVTQLPNPPKDAQAIATKLKALGFEVTLRENQGKAALEQTVATFTKQSKGAAVAIVFYAGHGLQVEGHNYLIPVDIGQIDDESDLHRQAVDLEWMVRETTKVAQASFVLLDACRNNPGLESRMQGSTRALFRDVRLAEVPRGTVLVLYATSRGQRALDSVGSGAKANADHLSPFPVGDAFLLDR